MKISQLTTLVIVSSFSASGIFTSCSTPATATSDELPQLFGFLDTSEKVNKPSRPDRPTRLELNRERKETERLKEIASRPTSRKPTSDSVVEVDAPERNFELESEMPEERAPADEVEKLKTAKADQPPASKLPGNSIKRTWDVDELKSAKINIGDIFSEKKGMRIRKSASINDAFEDDNNEAKKGFFSSITKTESYKVPLTISQEELGELKQKVKKSSPLPSRSVALDFESRKRSAKPEDLEILFGKLTSGSVPELEKNKKTEAKLNQRLTETKERLAKGEKLYVVTGVTESDALSANYPGAPVGTRDAEPIKNAVETMFPQLDELEASKDGEKVSISREPSLYWGFEARELSLENDQIVIERDSSIQH